MAGPGIRYHQIASLLSNTYDVTLGVFNPAYIEGLSGVTYKFRDIKTFDYKSAFDEADVIIALWLSEEMIDYAKSRGKKLIFDLYAPVPVENLVGFLFSKKELAAEDDYNYAVSLDNYRRFLQTGDFFMCSNEVQKDYWTGFGFASGGLLPSSYDSFPLYDRIGVCAMGINLGELKTVSKSKPLRKNFPAIKDTDFVLVWTGGIWDWFDSETPIRAIKKLHDDGKTNIKLVFLGTRHPNKDVPEMGETEKAFKLAEELGLKDKAVFFLTGWLKYDERLSYFLEADAALYAHKPSIESRFSHRTRVLDHILAGLPTIATEGDYFADLINARNLGIAVPVMDSEAMAVAIYRLQNRKTYEAMRGNIIKIQDDFTWQNTMKPLLQFLAEDAPARPAVNPLTPLGASGGVRSKVLLKPLKRVAPRPLKEAAKRWLVKRTR